MTDSIPFVVERIDYVTEGEDLYLRLKVTGSPRLLKVHEAAWNKYAAAPLRVERDGKENLLEKVHKVQAHARIAVFFPAQPPADKAKWLAFGLLPLKDEPFMPEVTIRLPEGT